MKLLKAFLKALGVLSIPAAIVGGLILVDSFFGVIPAVGVSIVTILCLITFACYED